MLKIFNTLTRNKEEFRPLSPPLVKIYSCGVTVYDHCHIGHGRSLYIFEVMRRYLNYKGFKVKFVRNITDVDDKIINKAKQWSQERRISLEEAFTLVRETYIKSYYEDLGLLKLPPADIEPKATENIPYMIDFIKRIIDKGYAYQREGNVYFSVRKFASYGKLSGKKLDELFQGVRIERDPLKKDPFDFALWKRRKEGEPYWSSPFGEGRPGWHIECSVMAERFLGSPLDIHGGGKDLIFPHHENEIAQSESIGNSPFSRYWLHHGLITFNKEKMAKSLGNFFTIKEVTRRFSHEALKLFYLSAHYTSPLDFDWERLEEAEAQRKRLYIVYDYLKDIPSLPIKREEILNLTREFAKAMDDDFNIPQAKALLFSLSPLVGRDKNREFLGEVKNFLLTVGNIFSLFQEEIQLPEDFKKYIEERISQRKRLRQEKKFREADKIREELTQKGIILEDLSDGTTRWRMKR